MGERFIEIKLTKCTLYLTPNEIQSLLKHDTDLWKTALGRGKAFKRSTTQRQREADKHAQNEAERFHDQ